MSARVKASLGGCGKTSESYTNGKGTSSTRALSRARSLRLEPLGEYSHEQEAFFRNLFSRAAKSSKIDRALAPAVGFLLRNEFFSSL